MDCRTIRLQARPGSPLGWQLDILGPACLSRAVRLWSGPNDMARKRFTTNRRLWLAVSLVLFVPPWFFFECETPGERLHPAVLWLVFFDPPLNLSAAIGGIVAFTLLFGIPAVAIGWVIQSLIIVLRNTVRPNTGAAAEP